MRMYEELEELLNTSPKGLAVQGKYRPYIPIQTLENDIHEVFGNDYSTSVKSINLLINPDAQTTLCNVVVSFKFNCNLNGQIYEREYDGTSTTLIHQGDRRPVAMIIGKVVTNAFKNAVANIPRYKDAAPDETSYANGDDGGLGQDDDFEPKTRQSHSWRSNGKTKQPTGKVYKCETPGCKGTVEDWIDKTTGEVKFTADELVSIRKKKKGTDRILCWQCVNN